MVYVADDCNCVFHQIFLHVIIFEFSLVNYTENATELFMHEQTVDVLPDYFRAPGNKATEHLGKLIEVFEKKCSAMKAVDNTC